jgi:hypothetical protein
MFWHIYIELVMKCNYHKSVKPQWNDEITWDNFSTKQLILITKDREMTTEG